MSVSELAQQHKVVVFSWLHCPYCLRAREILKPLHEDVKFYDVDTMPNGEDLRKEIYNLYKHETVPAVFVNGQFIGGCSDLEKLQSSGQLHHMLGIAQ